MKEYLRQLTEGSPNAIARNGLAREYLQARVLEALQDEGAVMRWAFGGGTALRFLYSIPRFVRSGLVPIRPPLARTESQPAQCRPGADRMERSGHDRRKLARRLEVLEWERARADVRLFLFLERERDMDLVSYDTLKKLLAPA